jgi:hypothetical protein
MAGLTGVEADVLMLDDALDARLHPVDFPGLAVLAFFFPAPCFGPTRCCSG